jgi:heptaprenyl diphosphate synthase
MLACSRIFAEKMSLAGVGVLGSLASNITQILFARYFLLGEGAWLIGPPFLALGTTAGFLLGLSAEVMEKKSAWIARLRSAEPESRLPEASIRMNRGSEASALFYALCGALCVIPFLFTASLAGKLFLTTLYLALSLCRGGRIRILPNIVLVLTVTAAQCVTPFGKILFTLGSFPITEGALRAGLFKSATLMGLIYLSRLTVRPGLRFPGRLGRIFSAMLSGFERITGCSIRIERKNFWASLDRLLAAVYEGKTVDSAGGKPQSAGGVCAGRFARRAAWLGFAALHWLVFAFG